MLLPAACLLASCLLVASSHYITPHAACFLYPISTSFISRFHASGARHAPRSGGPGPNYLFLSINHTPSRFDSSTKRGDMATPNQNHTIVYERPNCCCCCCYPSLSLPACQSSTLYTKHTPNPNQPPNTTKKSTPISAAGFSHAGAALPPPPPPPLPPSPRHHSRGPTPPPTAPS